jgi:hypothetical protein
LRILTEVRNAYITDKTDHKAYADTESKYEQAELVENGVNGTSIDQEVLMSENVVYDTPYNQISVSDDVVYENEVPIYKNIAEIYNHSK